MTKVQKRILSLAKELGGVTYSDILARQIPFTALKAMIEKGKLINNVGSGVYYINPISE